MRRFCSLFPVIFELHYFLISSEFVSCVFVSWARRNHDVVVVIVVFFVVACVFDHDGIFAAIRRCYV